MDNFSKPLLQIKGISGGLLVSIKEGEWLGIQQTLIELIQEKGNFFHGAKIAIDVGLCTHLFVDQYGARAFGKMCQINRR